MPLNIPPCRSCDGFECSHASRQFLVPETQMGFPPPQSQLPTPGEGWGKTTCRCAAPCCLRIFMTTGKVPSITLDRLPFNIRNRRMGVIFGVVWGAFCLPLWDKPTFEADGPLPTLPQAICRLYRDGISKSHPLLKQAFFGSGKYLFGFVCGIVSTLGPLQVVDFLVVSM